MFKKKLDISVNGESKKVIFINEDQNSVINYLFFNGYTKRDLLAQHLFNND